MGLKNPYIPLNVEDPSLAQKLQKNLFGDGLQVIIHLKLIHLFFSNYASLGKEGGKQRS